MSETTVAVTEPVTVTETKTNKSKLILAAFKATSLKTPANDIIDAIKNESGVEVTSSLVNNIRHRLRKQKAARKAKKEAVEEQPQVVVEPVVTGNGLLEKLLAVKTFAATVGGLGELKTLVDQLERLAA